MEVFDLEPHVLLLDQPVPFYPFQDGFRGADLFVHPSFASRALFSQSGIYESLLSLSSARIAPQFECPQMTTSLNLQVHNSVFKHGCKVPVMDRDNIPDIPLDKQFPCPCLGDMAGLEAGVRTPDPEDVGCWLDASSR